MPSRSSLGCRREYGSQFAVDAATDDDFFLSPEPDPDPEPEPDPEPDPEPEPEADEPELLESADEPDEVDDLAASELDDEPSDEDPLDPAAAPSLPAATVLDPFRLSVR